jgi:2-polyprenyl-3-methyl-5-hydroxy-6-metoxy-1,4-benzoquinol methylase
MTCRPPRGNASRARLGYRGRVHDPDSASAEAPAENGVPERFVPATMRGQLIEAEHMARYWYATAFAAGRRVLDAGCGVGYGTEMLARAGAAEAVGVDVAAEAIESAQRDAADGARFLVGDIRELPFDDGSFDLVVCFEAIEHVEGHERALAELARVLDDRGVLVVSSPNPEGYPAGNPHHVHELRPDELRAELSALFSHVELRHQQGWIASAVLDDEQMAAASLDELDVRVAKLLAGRLGEQPFSIGIASREPLPIAPARMVLTGMVEAKAWLGQVRDAERELARAYDELRETRNEVGLAQQRFEREQREFARVREVLEADNAKLLERLERSDRVLRAMQASASWRLTRPLRAAKRLRG